MRRSFRRLQVATFRTIGVSEFSSRLPQYLSAYVAVAVLCEFLIGRGLAVAALALALAWVGDRSSQEVMCGRMDGIALLFVVMGFVALVRAIERRTWFRGAICGLSLGMAAGFHPVTATFGLAAVVLLVAYPGARGRLRALVGFVVGLMVPLALILWSWSPDIPASFEQFQWNLRKVRDRATTLQKLVGLATGLRWSRFWLLGLAGTVVAGLAPAAIVQLVARPVTAASGKHGPLWISACVFATAALGCLVHRAVYAYYFVYFTVWPVVGLAVTLTAGLRLGVFRAWFRAIAAAVIFAWVGSLLWNGMRLRESLICRGQLDHAHFIRQVKAVIPARAEVTGNPLLLLLAKEAGLNFTPLPWYPEQAPAPPQAWLLLSRKEWQTPKWIAPASLARRPIIAERDAFPGPSPFFRLEYVILGPTRAADGDGTP